MANTHIHSSKEIIELLQWHSDIGVDEALSEKPRNWFEDQAETKHNPLKTKPQKEPVRPQQTSKLSFTPDDQVIHSAQELAASCHSIQDIKQALMKFDACSLKKTAQNLVFYDGCPEAKILLLGEAPGADEDREGKPFVGRSGKLLDKILRSIDLSRNSEIAEKSVCISNVIFWRPPGNRKPTDLEAHLCLPFVEKLIEIMNPEIIVCLGATPMQRLVGSTQGILRSRGKWREYHINDKVIPLLPTLHPAYLLRAPAQKKLAWQDFLSLKEKLASL